ncbi:DnaJ C-terminal domain-containing protein [Saccharopolyspora phatthalungensis]|uniref:Curved DNA-binding protein n=1 Tax=Saccharopolyspora phatthalungensis TaxID=664693 RepID=A0A840QIC8_9PSEU|nr:J domain-containing protein [Saccharopolyspora phatthalungensis]MBB5158608.1 curved DNA-binding protein [Saccharopolyspora phatthalungensis]
MARDYYEMLGVSRNASSEEVQQAYRKLARRYHPDVNSDPESEERFKEINEAYSVLSDPDTRKRYDRFGPDFRSIPEGYEEWVGAGQGARRGGGRPGAGGRGGVRVSADEGFGGVGFEDLFGSLFGARGAAGPIPGADQEAELELTVEEAYRGGKRNVTLSGPSGPRTFEVTIPRGVVDGQRIRLSGQGGRGGGNVRPGDLYLVVHLAPHSHYRVSGRDIYVDLPVTPWEAALGAMVPLTTPGGETKVRVPPGSSSGRRLRLRGEGMPNPRGSPGDLYAEVRIAVPPKLTDRERELLQQLAAQSSFDPRRS